MMMIPLALTIFGVSANLIEVWSPEDGAIYPSRSVPVFVGASVDDLSCRVCVGLAEANGKMATLSCRPITALETEQLVLQDLLPGTRRVEISLVDARNNRVLAAKEVTFRSGTSGVDIAAASGTSPWARAVPRAANETAARREYFEAVYATRFWTGRDPGLPASGPGSSPRAASNAKKAISSLIAELDIDFLLDAPCGDFAWMAGVRLPERYAAVDLVDVGRCPNFTRLDLVSDDAPRVLGDITTGARNLLIVCRHLLFHLPGDDARRVLAHLSTITSSTSYLLISTYLRADDNDRPFVLADGHRTNLFRPPFCAPDPIRLYRDAHHDQFLGLWEQLPASWVCL